ncbi:signal peptidase I [Aeromicrobium sp. 636]|uniref:Signal peptidase I n=1 Tax=Aeromicrobium senzhongii TaxID=2663859 RepID=A0A8I0ESP5_9ACTN|nr:signal peptidase I [Aeromicrobium sp. 636]MBC9224713.1 signal peptidase I [Aeromicrobium senzhongii]MCQ3996826.1 signal peptidase I [Aeromicrobium sp. 636]
MTDETSRGRRVPWWLEVPLFVVATLVLALVVKALLFQAFVIPSSSMVPTLAEQDKIVVQKWSYWAGEPQRGDVVVFKDPGQWLTDVDPPSPWQRALQAVGLSPAGGHLVKRVIGVAGDEVRCCDAEGRTLVNGEPVDEPYLADAQDNAERTFQVTVPRGRLWVQGDNRGNSKDSRLHVDDAGEGFVPVDLVVGRLWWRVWPLDRFGGVGGTDAFERVPRP